ncbi:acetyltransferase [Paenibacillus sp. SYP-B3998]|uniref:Acetyltransferase n=1 Tax=Paenibacillus sp. SYP-B3998 TaxID=2678564 RepID=A0A6G4A2A7_9BACL|nr:acetyltransferase [Paenibacillus sp. SYP-B3998]NEW08522.1 acetyltransferase [Paenibacillus sp. SYP-B3998]
MMIGIVGAGGHAKVVTDLLRRTNRNMRFVYLSADASCTGYEDMPCYLDSEPSYRSLRSSVEGWHVAIGNTLIRKRKTEWMLANGLLLINAIHDRSVCAEQSEIGIGSSVMAGAVVNPFAVIGQGCIINTASSVDHDCVIESFVNIGPGCRLSGSVRVAQLSDLGAGTVVIPGVSIGEHCVIGAGAVVISDIPDYSLAVGVPARVIKRIASGSS